MVADDPAFDDPKTKAPPARRNGHLAASDALNSHDANDLTARADCEEDDLDVAHGALSAAGFGLLGDRLYDQVAALRSSLEEARKDSERLDWMLAQSAKGFTRVTQEDESWYFSGSGFPETRADIDYEMRAAPPTLRDDV